MKKLPKNKYQDIFFSSHFDDVVLSCGGIVASLINKKRVLVVTVFTNAGEGKLSRFAKKYLEFCNFKNYQDYFNSRKKEERKAAEILRYETCWLDLPEAIFRFEKRRFIPRFYYNNKKQLLGKIDREDEKLVGQVKRKVREIIRQYSDRNSQLYFPLAIGNHVDHQLLYQIGMEINKKRIFFYEDFPYILKINKKRLENSLSQIGLKIKKIPLKDKYIRKKYEAILTYKSQIKLLFETQENFKKQFFKYHQKSYENYWYFI